MIEKQLLQLGFHKNDVAVYLALFDLGKCKAGEIIELTKLHRNLVYTSLEVLIKRGLATKTEGSGVALFSPNDPKYLVEEIEQKKQLAETIAEEIKSKGKQSPRDIVVYEGIEGLKRATDQNLHAKPGETVYILGSSLRANQETLSKHWEKFHKKRAEKGILSKILYDRSIDPWTLNKRNQLPLTEAKYMPSGIDAPFWFNICGDEFFLGVADEDPIAFKMRSKTVTDGLKHYFDYLWNQDVSVVRGVDALRKTFLSMIDEVGSGGTYSVLGAFAPVDENPYLNPIFEEVHTYRVKKKTHVNMLVYREFYEKMKKRFRSCGDPDFIYSHAKPYLTKSPSPFQINLYNGKAVLIFYGEEPTVISFDKPEVYEGFKSYFDELWDQHLQTFQGHDGIISLCEKVLEEGKDVYLINANGRIMETHPDYFQKFNARRIQKNMKCHMLANKRLKGSAFTKLFLSDVHYLPDTFNENPMVIWIFGDYVANVMWHDPQTVFLIHDASVAEYYRTYYNALCK